MSKARQRIAQRKAELLKKETEAKAVEVREAMTARRMTARLIGHQAQEITAAVERGKVLGYDRGYKAARHRYLWYLRLWRWIRRRET